jgi:hypothetical protein
MGLWGTFKIQVVAGSDSAMNKNTPWWDGQVMLDVIDCNFMEAVFMEKSPHSQEILYGFHCSFKIYVKEGMRPTNTSQKQRNTLLQFLNQFHGSFYL